MSGRIASALAHEVRALIPVTLFFLVALELLALTDALLSASEGIKAWPFAAAAVGALIVAKVILIADHTPLMNRFAGRPLLYGALWRTLIYFIGSLVIRYAEHLIHFSRREGGIAEGNRALLQEVVWPHFWCVQLWLLVLLFVYSAAREYIGSVGIDHVRRAFFSSRAPTDAPAKDH